MKYSIIFKFLLIFGAFGSIYFFWYKNQSVSLTFNTNTLNETKKSDSINSFGGSYENSSPTSSKDPITDISIKNQSPNSSTTSEEISTVLDMSPNTKTEDNGDTLILSLKEAFTRKYNRDTSNTHIFIDDLVDSFIKGSVDFDNSGHTAAFYAYKSSDSDIWQIATVENGIVACTDIDPYNFPVSIIPQCYSYSSGTVVNR